MDTTMTVMISIIIFLLGVLVGFFILLFIQKKSDEMIEKEIEEMRGYYNDKK